MGFFQFSDEKDFLILQQFLEFQATYPRFRRKLAFEKATYIL